MHARTVTIESRPENLDTAIQLYQDKVLPGAASERGFRGGLLLSDKKSGKGMSITFWESEADMLASEKSGFFQRALDSMTSIMVGKPVREVYEVSVNTAIPAATGPGMAAGAPAGTTATTR